MVIIRQKADDALGHKERKQRKTNIRNEKKKKDYLIRPNLAAKWRGVNDPSFLQSMQHPLSRRSLKKESKETHHVCI